LFEDANKLALDVWRDINEDTHTSEIRIESVKVICTIATPFPVH